MTNDLIERYIYAVTKKLPAKQQRDISEELRTLIADMLEERCGDVVPAEKDVRVILTELGTPNELSEKYDTSGKTCLIGAPYYATYRLVLKIVLICVTFGMTLATAISLAASPAQPWYESAFQWLGMLWSGLLQAFAFVTLLFAIFYHKGVKLDQDTSLDDLPPVPKKDEMISKWEPVFGIAISVLFLAVFLVAPQIFCAILPMDGAAELIPIFQTETVRGTWYLIVAFSVAGIAREIVRLLEGSYTRKVLAATLVTDVISAILSIWWLTNDQLINPAFIARFEALFSGDAAFIGTVFANFQHFFLGVLLFALALDAVTTTVKTLRRRAG